MRCCAAGRDLGERARNPGQIDGAALGSDLEAIAGTSLDKGIELDALAKMKPGSFCARDDSFLSMPTSARVSLSSRGSIAAPRRIAPSLSPHFASALAKARQGGAQRGYAVGSASRPLRPMRPPIWRHMDSPAAAARAHEAPAVRSHTGRAARLAE